MLTFGCFDVVLVRQKLPGYFTHLFFATHPETPQCFATRPRHTLSATYTPVIYQRAAQRTADFKDDSDPDRSCVW